MTHFLSGAEAGVAGMGGVQHQVRHAGCTHSDLPKAVGLSISSSAPLKGLGGCGREWGDENWGTVARWLQHPTHGKSSLLGTDVLKRGILWILRKDHCAEWGFQHSEELHQGHRASCVIWGLPEWQQRRPSSGTCPVRSWPGGCHLGMGLPEGAATPFSKPSSPPRGFPGGSDGKESTCNAGDPSLIPGSGRSPREGNGSPFQCSCLENPMDGGAWRATVHGVTESRHDWATNTFTFSHTVKGDGPPEDC